MGHMTFRHDVTSVCVDVIWYVMLVTRVKQIFKFTFKFTLTFTSAFHLAVITWVPFMLES